MESQPERRETRRQEIGDRIAAISTRLDELRLAQQENKHPVAASERIAEAQRHAAISEATAQQALAASIEAFLHAAEAHERAAAQHEHIAATRGSREKQHRERAAFHRAAAAADRQRADTAQSLVFGRQEDG